MAARTIGQLSMGSVALGTLLSAQMTPTMSLAAYNPVTGQLVWQTEIQKTTNSGNLVTAGDLVFQGVASDLYALDARSGRQLLRATVNGSIRASCRQHHLHIRAALKEPSRRSLYVGAPAVYCSRRGALRGAGLRAHYFVRENL